MNATLTTPLHPTHPSWPRRFVGVLAQPDTYRNLAYLALGLPLGTLWFTLLVTGFSVGVSMVVVALVGIPLLVGLAYVTRASANVERRVAATLLHEDLPSVPMASPKGNVWVRLRAMARDRQRQREVGFLFARFPAGIATFTAAVTAITVPFSVAYAPFQARTDDSQPFGDWFGASRLEDIASSNWAWFLVPLGFVLLVAGVHALNGLARACGRWTHAALAP